MPWPLILIALLCFIIYMAIYRAPWLSDDVFCVTTNEAIRSLSNTGAFFLDPVKTTAPLIEWRGMYRPIQTLSFALDYRLWGLRPFGFHLSNVVIHAIVSCLVYTLCNTVGISARFSLLAALIFAAHPANVEPVMWVSSRNAGLSLTFLLASFLLFFRSRGIRRFPSAMLAASLGLFMLAVLSKETAIVLPVMLVARDVLLPRTGKPVFRRTVIEYCMFAAVIAAYFIWRTALLKLVAQQEYWGGGLLSTMLTMSKCFALYLKIVFFPSIKNCMNYAVPIATSVYDHLVAGSIGILMLFCVLGALAWRFNPLAGFGLTWFCLGLLPVSNVIPLVELMAERFLYLPLVGIAISAASFMEKIEDVCAARMRKALYLMIAMLLIVYSSITIGKSSAWRDPEILLTQSLEAYPHDFAMRMGLGLMYHERGLYLDALNEYAHALRASPKHWRMAELLSHMGDSYSELQDYEAAVGFYNASLRIDPKFAHASINLGKTYLKQGRVEEAVKNFRRALEIDPRLRVAVSRAIAETVGSQAPQESFQQR